MFNKIKKTVNNMNLHKVRFIIQILAFILFVYGGYFAIDFGSKLPIFTCPYNKAAPGACYLIPLQHQLSIPTKVLLGGYGFAVITGLFGFLLWFVFLNKEWESGFQHIHKTNLKNFQ
jgi:ferredoxin-type protein NapH